MVQLYPCLVYSLRQDISFYSLFFLRSLSERDLQMSYPNFCTGNNLVWGVVPLNFADDALGFSFDLTAFPV